MAMDSQQPPIILANNAYWPSIGGVENSIRHLAAEARKKNRKVKVFVGDIGVSQREPIKINRIDGVRVYRYKLQPFNSFFLRPFNLLASFWIQYRLYRREARKNPDSVVISRFHLCALAARFAKFYDVKYLVPSLIHRQSGIEQSNSDVWITRWKKLAFLYLHKYLQQRSLLVCENYVFSHTMQNQCSKLSGLPPEHFKLVKPGVDAGRFNYANPEERSELRQKLNLCPNRFQILFVGRFVKAKGVDLLIDAASKLSSDFQLVLVGEGAEKESYVKRVSSLGLSDRVRFVGPTRTVEDYFRCSDLFVMSSRYEPLGQTLLEAFSSGLPVIAFSKLAGVDTATEELGMDEYTCYVDSLNACKLASAIDKINERYLGMPKSIIAAEAQFKFSWPKLLDDLSGV